MNATRALRVNEYMMMINIENSELIGNIASLTGRHTVSVTVSYCCRQQIRVRFKSQRKLIAICGKLAAVSHGIWQTGRRNHWHCQPWGTAARAPPSLDFQLF